METSELLKLVFKAAQGLKDEDIIGSRKMRTFNNTEMRLIGCVIVHNEMGKEIISTQIAESLGITRSAVSQMVNRLEERGVVKRIPSEYDRKISFIRLTDSALEEYNKQKAKVETTIGKISELMGEKDMNQLARLITKFIDCKEKVLGK